MGLHDRAYMQGDNGPRGLRPGGGSSLPFSMSTLHNIIKDEIYIGQLVTESAFGPRTLSTGLSLDPLAYYGHFSTAEAVFGIEFWRFLTFQFLHASPMHIAFNMLGIWFLGRMVEDQLGPKKYLAFYLVCGIFGGVMYLLLNFLGGVIGINFPLLLPNDPATPLIGASAGVYGVVMACAYIAPNATIQLLFPPIPMKMKTFAYGFVALAFVLLLFGTRNAGGQAAHLGGAIAGFFFIRNTHLLIDFFDVLGDSRKPKQPKGSRRLRGGGGGVSKDEVDAVLAKVQATGLGSLSDREREILRDATERQRRG